MSSAFSNVACGVGDFDDLCLNVHGEDFYEQLEKDAPFWEQKAEEVDKLGYYKLAAAFRVLADRMSENLLFED